MSATATATAPVPVTNPLRIPSACLIQPSPTIDRTIKKPHPVRSQARPTNPSTTTTTATTTIPITTATSTTALSISSNSLKTRRGRRRATIAHPNPKKADHANRWPIDQRPIIRCPAHGAQADSEPIIGHRLTDSPRNEAKRTQRPLSFSTLLPLLIRPPPAETQIHSHPPPSSSPSLPASSTVVSSIQSSIKFLSSQPSSPLNTLSFPEKPLVSPFIFHFSIPTPACHLPPPHPGPPSRLSGLPHSYPPFPPHQSRPSFYRPQTYPIWQSVPSSTSNSSSRTKSRVALPPEHYIRSKKIKLCHSFFRSSRIFYPVDRYPVQHLVLSCSSNSLVMSSTLKKESAPKWLHTSAAVGGYSSNLRPKEQRWTGNPQSWGIVQEIHRCSTFRSPQLPLIPQSPTSPKTPSPSALPQPMLRPSSSCGSQAAPLKAQLLAVLRMRSSLQPGEAALKLKKWVIWNSWVRGQAQNRFYPVTSSPHVGLPTVHSSHLYSSSTADSTRGHEWTGDEVFDDNGDLISDHELDRVTDEEDEEEEEEEEDLAALYPIDLSPPTPRSTGDPIKRSQTLIRLKLPARITTPKYSQHPTPPTSPASLKRSDVQDGDSEDDEVRKDDCYSSLGGIIEPLDRSNGPSKVDQTPVTPPPSPNH